MTYEDWCKNTPTPLILRWDNSGDLGKGPVLFTIGSGNHGHSGNLLDSVLSIGFLFSLLPLSTTLLMFPEITFQSNYFLEGLNELYWLM